MSRYTYRASDDIQMRIDAIRKRTGWSFQKLTDEFYHTLLAMYRTTPMFNELTTSTQIRKTTEELIRRSESLAAPLNDAEWHRIHGQGQALFPRI